MDEASFYIAFSVCPVIGPKRFRALLTTFQTAQESWNADNESLESAGVKGKILEKLDAFRKTFDLEKYVKKLKTERVVFMPSCDANYPSSLLALDDPPIGLFVKGNKLVFNQLNNQRSTINNQYAIAVVGTRKMTSYGREVTKKLVSELVTYDFKIVSGLALGVDACAHKTALENNGATVAVLGCGVDCPFPRENEPLYKAIIEQNGVIVSEYPLSQQPKPGTFPARNRIIAALSNAVLVTEAGEDSGSLITAEIAQKLGKAVFAVPGPITSSLSAGTSLLIKRGAKLVTSADDILEALQLNKKDGQKTHIDVDQLNVSHDETKILKLLQNEPLSIDSICKLSGIPISKLSPLLSNLELKGVAKSQDGIFGLSKR